MAATVASHLVKVEPENETWWINLAYSVRRSEGVEKAEAILLRAQAIHPKVAMIAFNLACYASVTGRMEEAKAKLDALRYKKKAPTLAHQRKYRVRDLSNLHHPPPRLASGGMPPRKFWVELPGPIQSKDQALSTD